MGTFNVQHRPGGVMESLLVQPVKGCAQKMHRHKSVTFEVNVQPLLSVSSIQSGTCELGVHALHSLEPCWLPMLVDRKLIHALQLAGILLHLWMVHMYCIFRFLTVSVMCTCMGEMHDLNHFIPQKCSSCMQFNQRDPRHSLCHSAFYSL